MAKAVTIRRVMQGKHELRLAQQGETFSGLADGKIIASGSDAEIVWQQLLAGLGTLDPNYFGYDGVRQRFLSIFPGGFEDAEFAAHERDYKDKARAKLLAALSPDAAAEGSGLGEAVLAVFRATNLLSSFEQVRMQNVLRSKDADAFIRAAGRFTLAPDANGLKALEAVLTPYDAAKWPIVTYLPYLWQPDRHMFLKPEVTKDFAARVGHPFRDAYESQIRFDVYARLLDLAERTETEIADLAPRDRIDIQSFIWVVGAYEEPGNERFTDPDVLLVKPAAGVV